MAQSTFIQNLRSQLSREFYPSEKDTPEDSHNLWMSYPDRKRAAVLAILYSPLTNASSTLKEYGLILTQRSPKLRVSPSVSAFPGGKVDPEDENDEWTTALREACEEIGFDPTKLPQDSFYKLIVTPCYLSLGNDAVRVCVCLVDTSKLTNLQQVSSKTEYSEKVLEQLAPEPSQNEVAVAYALQLDRLITKDWYFSGSETPVSGHHWIFHDYRLPVAEMLATRASHGYGIHPSPTAAKLERNQFSTHPERTTDTPKDLQYSSTESYIPLHGLTSHLALDIARAVHPEINPPFDVLNYLGSDRIVKSYFELKYINKKI